MCDLTKYGTNSLKRSLCNGDFIHWKSNMACIRTKNWKLEPQIYHKTVLKTFCGFNFWLLSILNLLLDFLLLSRLNRMSMDEAYLSFCHIFIQMGFLLTTTKTIVLVWLQNDIQNTIIAAGSPKTPHFQTVASHSKAKRLLGAWPVRGWQNPPH